jgi:lipopolysaccharide transport system ATP-binding protein
MSHVSIAVEGLGKQYRLVPASRRHNTLRDKLTAMAGQAWRWGRAWRQEADAAQSFWALRDVSFTVTQGDAVGIIGLNGAGKSTLLKILSRITEPTEGEARVRGRVGSLLEVGTGFHSELSGRENIYLSGAINGMTRSDISRQFDEIVSFAEVERFIDTPVKHYSSGMYLRLAFAVAAHLEPDVLIVDEVLAVGDVDFQRKCLGKMESVAGKQGRTVLFVSHNMNAIQRLCDCCILLRNGGLAAYGPTAAVVAEYFEGRTSASSPDQWFDLTGVPRIGSGEARFTAIQYTSGEAATAFQPYPFSPVEFTIKVGAPRPMEVGSIAVTFYDRAGAKLVNADSRAVGRSLRLAEGENVVRVRIDELYLNPGTYTLGLWLAPVRGRPIDHAEAALEIEVVDHVGAGLGERPPGDGLVPCRFEIVGPGGEGQ